jgi:segregation and condensation protein B
MDPVQIKHFVEAALLAAGRPLTIDQLQRLFDDAIAVDKAELREAIAKLNEEYSERGIVIAEVASGFRVQVRTAMADQLQKLWEDRPPRYSRALFETMALVAYRQPITRGEIEEIRGVSVTPNIIRTLIERDWVRVVGHRDVPGRPEMLGTTKAFLDYFGLKKLDDLPPLADLSDWESLRVQLNLPEVEETAGSDTGELPVLYPEVPDDDAGESADADAAAALPAAPEDDTVRRDFLADDDELPELSPIFEDAEDEDELVVSEWPDPAESGR